MKKLLVKIYVGLYEKRSLFVRYLRLKKQNRSVYKYILDKESKRILRLREKSILHNRDYEYFINNIAKEGEEFYIPELDGDKNLIVCQMGEEYSVVRRLHYTQILLNHSKYRNRYRCVNIKDDFEVNKNEILIPVWGEKEKLNIGLLDQKKAGGFLHIPAYAPVLVGTIGKQYFDIFEAKEQEVIVDCGACDGTTELEIAQWANFSYKKIYAFEPEKDNCEKCIAFYRKNNLKNIELIEKGTWSKEDILLFNKGTDGANAGGAIQTEGTEKVFVTSIDNVVGEEKVTFIKMDVEGSELASLMGAAKTIQRDKPRLAICIYHKESDLWEIPQYILKLNENYRFYIRHYSSFFYETVLYAEIR